MSDKYFKRDNYRGVIIFGCGNRGTDLLFELTVLGLRVIAFCDNNPIYYSDTKYGKPVISPDELIEKYSDAYVVVSPDILSYRVEIFNQLSEIGFSSERIYGTADQNSQISHLSSVAHREQYFDSQILEPQCDEVFVDAGAYDGYTSICFYNWCMNKNKPPRRIIAIEPHRESIISLRKNISSIDNCEVKVIDGCVSSSSGLLSFESTWDLTASKCSESGKETIQSYTIDDILSGTPATFIIMDIEGSELSALMGDEKTIKSFSPRLAICVYHKPEDLFVIPSFIKSINNGYRYYLRKYVPNCGELVLYAV